MKHTLLALLTVLIIFMIPAFYYLSFDPHKWAPESRAMFAVFALLLSICVFAGSKLDKQ